MGLKTDGFFMLLSIVLINSVRGYAVILLEPFLMAYCILRVLFILNNRLTTYLILFLILAFGVYELFHGYSQLFHYLGKGRGQDMIVGNFSSSGPFGCFLSVCCGLWVVVYTRSARQIIRFSSAVLAFLSFVLMTCTFSRAAVISFLVSMLFLAMKSKKTAAFIRKYRAYLLLMAVFIGTGAYLIKKPSADGRMLMARIGLRIMKENGLSSVGLGNYAGTYGKAQAMFFEEYLANGTDDLDISNIPENLRMTAGCPEYCFNEYLRVGIESGPVSMLLLICLVTAGIACLYGNDSIWCYPLVSISLFACFSYPFEVGVLTLLFIVCLASNGPGADKRIRGIMFYSLLFMVYGSVFYVRYPSIDRAFEDSASSFFDCLCGNRHKTFMVQDNSVLYDGLYDEKMLFAIGQSLNKGDEYEKSDSVLRLGTEISSDPMFWNVMGNNSLAQGKYKEAESRYKQAFYMVPNRLYPLCLLAKLYHEEGDSVRFLDMAGKIEVFVPKVESVNTDRLRSEIRELKSDFYGQTNR